MARRRPPPLAQAGFAIAIAALGLILALGFSKQTVAVADTVVGCGSVFSPQEEPACESTRADRTRLMWMTGLPGVGVGLGIVITVGRRERRGA